MNSNSGLPETVRAQSEDGKRAAPSPIHSPSPSVSSLPHRQMRQPFHTPHHSLLEVDSASLGLTRSSSAAPPEVTTSPASSPKFSALNKGIGRSVSLRTPKSGIRHGDNKALPAHHVIFPNSTPTTNPAFAVFQSQLYSPSSSVHTIKPRPLGHKSRNHQSGRSDSQLQQLANAQGSVEHEAKMTSAASSPGLFTPTSSPLRPEFTHSDTSEAYSSPFLHHTHRSIPKETNLAEVDVDPISGRKIVNQYEIISELGRGVYGKVKLGRNLETGQHVAIKIIERVSKVRRLGRTGDQEAKIKKEIAILKKARHPNIVGLLEVIDDPGKKKVYIVLEHVELGEVEWRVPGESEICFIEYRRSQREAEGIVENEAAVHEDQQILETAHRHLERQERRDWEEARRKEREGYHDDIGPWSLEHGGDSDVDEITELKSQAKRKPAKFVFTDPMDTDDHHDVDDTVNPVDTTLPPPEPHTLGEVNEQNEIHRVQTASSSDQFELDGTMYGAYDTSPQDREPSLLDSFASSREAYGNDRVPEHFRYVPTMTLADTRHAIRDTVLGLEYLHYQGVIHRDIKPANLLETSDHHYKISDFGVSYLGKASNDPVLGDEPGAEPQDFDEALELAKTVGTPAFYAPELCQIDIDEENPPPVNGQIDVWALGVTLYCLVFGRVPFHDNNTFALMRHIAEQEVYIPRERLKAVEPTHNEEGVSPLSRGKKREMINCNTRLSHELEYEPVSDDLYDLLKRLLTKDPRQRIKLKEVKNHAWLLAGLQDPSRWVQESDPSYHTHGKRIEVSKEEVDVAVAATSISAQLSSVFQSAGRKIRGAFGIGKGSSSRRRAKSAATDSQLSSAASSSSTISQDGKKYEARRPSLRPDEVLSSALKASRDDHPLSQSVTASPEIKDSPQFFSPKPKPDSPARQADSFPYGFQHQRPAGLERGMSATGSIRTIRQSDIAALTSSGSVTDPVLPSTPQPLDHPPPSLSGIFGGAKNKILRGFKSREFDRFRTRVPSSDRVAMPDDNIHAEPSIAVSHTIAPGVLNLPAALQDGRLASSPAATSPASSRATSISGHPELHHPQTTKEALSRQSSMSSVASKGQYPQSYLHSQSHSPLHPQSYFLPLTGEITDINSRSRPVSRSATTPDSFSRAKEEQLRRLILEGEQQRQSTPTSQGISIMTQPCPPSPDDLIDARKHVNGTHVNPQPPLSIGPSAVEQANASRIVNSSSDDWFQSGMSQSTSNPSLPSAYSASSSVTAEEVGALTSEPARYDVSRTRILAPQHQLAPIPNHEEDDGYTGDNAYDSDESSDESFIQMPSKKKPLLVTRHSRSTSHPVPSSSRGTSLSKMISSRIERRVSESLANSPVDFGPNPLPPA